MDRAMVLSELAVAVAFLFFIARALKGRLQERGLLGNEKGSL